MSEALNKPILKLSSKKASDRRSGAKALRKNGADEAFLELQDTLDKELNSQSWETQYQLIMALGQVITHECLHYLKSIDHSLIKYGMVFLALGDSITRIEIQLDCFDGKSLGITNEMYFDGVMRAITILKHNPSEHLIDFAIETALSAPSTSNTKKWVAAASACWPEERKIKFLQHCLKDGNQQTVRAAQASLEGKHLKWSIL